MTSESFLNHVATFAIALITAASIWFFTSWPDKRLHAKHPKSLPFKWGYWMGMLCFLIPLVMAIDNTMLALVLAPIYFPVGIFVSRRQRWALVTATILSINPLLWIINTIYIRNRWVEMSSSSNALSSHPQ